MKRGRRNGRWCAHALDGLFQFGVPEVFIHHVTKEAIWTRRAALPESTGYIGRTDQWGFAHQWLVDRWGYGGYGPVHMIIWIILVIAFVAGVMWRVVRAQQKKSNSQ